MQVSYDLTSLQYFCLFPSEQNISWNYVFYFTLYLTMVQY